MEHIGMCDSNNPRPDTDEKGTELYADRLEADGNRNKRPETDAIQVETDMKRKESDGNSKDVTENENSYTEQLTERLKEGMDKLSIHYNEIESTISASGTMGQNVTKEDRNSLYQKVYLCYKTKNILAIHTLVLGLKADVNHIFNEPFVEVSDRGLALIHFLSQKGDLTRMISLIQELSANPGLETKKGDTPLHLACKHGHYRCVEFLIQYSPKFLDKQNLQGLTPLMKAIYRLDTAFKEKDYMKTIDLLINAGCDVNISPESGITPLHVVAGKWKSENMIKKLIKAGASVNADSGSSSPLLVAVCRQRIDSGTVVALIDAGADVNYRNKNKKSVLHIAVSKSEDICVEHLLKAGADANLEDQDGNSPLWIAVYENNIRIAPLLLAHGANVGFCNKQFRLSLVAKATMNRNINMVKLLLENNADVNITTFHGASPLHYAISNEDITITKLLLSKNCDMENYSTFRNVYNPQNALQIALELGNSDIIKLLLLAGFPLAGNYLHLNNLPDIVREDSELVEWIYDYLYSPQPLQHITSICLRRHYGGRLTQAVDALTKEQLIPQSLADYIHLKHFLDERRLTAHEYAMDLF